MMGYILSWLLIIFCQTTIIATKYLSYHHMSHKHFLLLHFKHSELKESIFITLGYIVPLD